MASKVRTLIVDDSAYMRVVLKDMLESDPGIEVTGVAKDGLEAVEKVRSLSPDVVLLDIQMPRMDGIATLHRIMKETPTRVIMLSAMDKKDDQLPLRALEMGAVDFISKPSGPVSIDIVNFTDKIIEIVKTAAAARIEAIQQARAPPPRKMTALRQRAAKDFKSIVIAASTGGPRALETIFAALPSDLPAPIFIVQHIPEDFSVSFAKRLDSAKGPRVVLATDGQKVEPGVAYLAPGGRHLKLNWRGATKLLIKLDDGGPVNFVKPSADVLFSSVAECVTCHTLAVVLTGMGSDGARGALAIKKTGGKVIVQNEKTSIVFGMPRAVIEAGAADSILPLEEIPRAIVEFLEEE
jgi:two-component system chemotaxis response regulator CheB